MAAEREPAQDVCSAQGEMGQQSCPNAETPDEFPELPADAALFLDLDGTLVEIAPTPEQVQVAPFLPELLSRLAEQRGGALAVVSGRRLADIDRLLAPWRGAAAGLHGVERRRGDGFTLLPHSDADAGAAAALEAIRQRAAAFAGEHPGVRVEDKGRSLALHYRTAPEHGAATAAFAERSLAAHADVLRLIPGKMVFEMQPRGHGKDRAIAAFLSEPPFAGRIAVFLGDDVTDEDGFGEVNRRGGMSIRVGKPMETLACFSLPSVTAVLAWLQRAASR